MVFCGLVCGVLCWFVVFCGVVCGGLWCFVVFSATPGMDFYIAGFECL